MYAVLPLWEQKTVKLHANGHTLLIVECKPIQQLPTMLGSEVHQGKDTTHKTLEQGAKKVSFTACHSGKW